MTHEDAALSRLRRLRPMLATDAGGRPFDHPDWVFEIKWDGVRALAGTAAGDGATLRLVSRAGNDLTPAYPEIAALGGQVRGRAAVLDGEIVALDGDGRPSFQLLQRRMHVRAPAAVERLRRDIPVVYMAFDLLAIDDAWLLDAPLSQRLARLDEHVAPRGALAISDREPEHGTALFAAAAEHGLEGLIAKRLGSRYQAGQRSRDWLKLKVRRSAELVIGGWLGGQGQRAGGLGSLLLGAYDGVGLRYVGRAGTGFGAAEQERLERLLASRAVDAAPFTAQPAPPPGAQWVRPDLVCRVEYGEMTDEGVLRAPAYKGLSPEADPAACTVDQLW